MSDLNSRVNPTDASPLSKGVQTLISSIILILLLGVVAAGTSENIHAQMLKLGIYIWDDYIVLRGDAPKANCKLSFDIEERLDQLQREHEEESAVFDIFEAEFDRESARDSLQNQIKICEKKHREAEVYEEKLTFWVRSFRSLEHSFADISLFAIAQQKNILILLLMIAGAVATWKKEHIAFRGVKSQFDHYLSTSIQAISAACLSVSTYAYYKGSYAAGTIVTEPELMIILITGSAIISSINFYQLATPPKTLNKGGSPLHALLTVPIHSYMLLAAAYHFFLTEQHLPGISIYFTQIFQLTNLHLAVGLYILVGMLLKETLLGAKLFDVFKPWRFPPEILAFVAIALMAVPTAYTGASGIIIIAMGAVVYQELRRVGTRRQLALAVTAMTGSSGVVLRPCLLVVGIAILNKEVVTDELFHWGFRVFLLTLVVFFFYALITRQGKLEVAPVSEAAKPSLQLLKPLAPYFWILLACLAFYGIVLNTYLDEFSAPTILPVIIIAVIIYERKFSKTFHDDNKIAGASPTVPSAFNTAINNTSVQIGALIMLMACSFTVGGIIESGGGVLEIPENFTSAYAAMAFLVLFLVLIGMIMDPFGALILVTGTIAPVAYEYGIEPIHFWMTCLVAFELGYLSPPVSLNHLLTRQVVGDKEVTLSMQEGDSFYYRHEKLILPLMVMSTTLVLVAFVPLAFY